MEIYVKNVVREPKDTLYSFLIKVLNVNNFFKKGCVNSTFYDKELFNLQCHSDKYRSFDDLILISKTYFKVSDKAAAKALKKILDKEDFLKFVLCDTAKKWVLNFNLTNSDKYKYCFTYNNSPNKTKEYLKGKYSFEDIIHLMGLTMDEILIE